MINIPQSEIDPAQNRPIRDIAIVGGGLAGLSSACALASSGYRVHVIERRPYVGGRASSYEHPGTGEVVDNCQHVLLGCCTNLIGFYQQLGVEDKIRWFDEITFLEPGGRRSILRQSRFFPAPLHNALSFLAAPALSLADKLTIARGMISFFRSVPADSPESFGQWLRHHGQTKRAIDRFWNPVLVSALNEELDRVSVHYAGMVFRESFLRSPQAGWMGVPAIPLSELYGHAIGFIESQGGRVMLRKSVEDFAYDAAACHWSLNIGDEKIDADALIFAVPFESMQRLLPALAAAPGGNAKELEQQLSHFEHSPITGIHLWFDRHITDLPHAVLLDATIQWMYNKSLLQPAHRQDSPGSYLELVVSASKLLIGKSRQEIIDLAVLELAEFFPAARNARLLKSVVIKEVRATFSITPGLDASRPSAGTAWPRLFLAGDWTATGWPATMEGAVRSGYLAAEALTQAAGAPRKFLHPDLPPQGFMRLFA